MNKLIKINLTYNFVRWFFDMISELRYHLGFLKLHIIKTWEKISTFSLIFSSEPEKKNKNFIYFF